MHCGHSYGIQSRCLQHEAFCDGVNRQKPPSASLGEYKCNICTKIFMKSRNLRRHILTHTEVKPYRCKACDSCFSRHDHLKLHQSRCKGKRQRLEVRIAKISLADVGRGWQNNLNITDSGKQQGFDCSICSKIFPSHSIMSRHIAMSHAIRTVSSFTHEKSLKRHINIGACQRFYAKTKLSEKLNVTSPPSRETNRLLQRIQLQYKDKRKFKCTFCPRLFKSGEQLRVHTRLHTGEKPFGCSNCGERFIRRDYLQHMRTHLGEYPFNCKKCNKGFWNKNLCRKHVRKCR
uniref:C2H2-type domain-containing protein n=1 Tax=Oncorhynchus kisutch TaxID=8019 RepID=A0A8C7FSD4_ONCKI